MYYVSLYKRKGGISIVLSDKVDFIAKMKKCQKQIWTLDQDKSVTQRRRSNAKYINTKQQKCKICETKN